MMSETLTLMVVPKPCQASVLGLTEDRVGGGRYGQVLQLIHSLEHFWEQTIRSWGLTRGLTGKRRGLDATGLLALGGNQ